MVYQMRGGVNVIIKAEEGKPSFLFWRVVVGRHDTNFA